jgi:hypothetical protein
VTEAELQQQLQETEALIAEEEAEDG